MTESPLRYMPAAVQGPALTGVTYPNECGLYMEGGASLLFSMHAAPTYRIPKLDYLFKLFLDLFSHILSAGVWSIIFG